MTSSDPGGSGAGSTVDELYEGWRSSVTFVSSRAAFAAGHALGRKTVEPMINVVARAESLRVRVGDVERQNAELRASMAQPGVGIEESLLQRIRELRAALEAAQREREQADAQWQVLLDDLQLQLLDASTQLAQSRATEAELRATNVGFEERITTLQHMLAELGVPEFQPENYSAAVTETELRAKVRRVLDLPRLDAQFEPITKTSRWRELKAALDAAEQPARRETV